MKRFIRFFAVIIIATSAILLSSCATGLNKTYLEDYHSTVAPFDQNNFTVVKRVEGEHIGEKILFMGGLSDDYLKESALSNMYDNAKLTGSQTIIDIHIVKSRVFVLGPLYIKTIHKTTGTVIEFTGPKEDTHVQNVQIIK